MERAEQIKKLIGQYLERRLKGEEASALQKQLLAEHPELQPGLKNDLRVAEITAIAQEAARHPASPPQEQPQLVPTQTGPVAGLVDSLDESARRVDELNAQDRSAPDRFVSDWIP